MDKTFAKDVIEGLTSHPKYLSSKYFYDDAGSRIFQEIMEMPTYYLSDSELDILTQQSNQIITEANFIEPFNIIELGAGDGSKIIKLLEYLVASEIDFNYVPIDISQEAITILSEKIKKQLPGISMQPKVGDYFEILKETSKSNIPNLLLFLGSNIGNYTAAQAEELLQLFNTHMNPNDKLLIGMDLMKNPNTIRSAYNDPEGVTKRFNMNLLKRINTEFTANFDLNTFDFYCTYNPINGAVKSYLVSLEEQEITLSALETTIQFQKNELIWTELSKKYSLPEIEALASKTGFSIQKNFFDSKYYFTDSLWVK
ncbi:L-histidine N(alpha)-methyltransferase [Ulvibacter litoralis]|uniref:Dimethylhistidine N-methyltransferase n=1 Tax=Ulvibacter litoralis TaxID=227084 RepID=A0A1G7FF49_9FLAO|nr:L-histidine N(alpha)-methyltransferase [Ulvibacter litoralis]GHC51410.1 dimethylhistidine N-methyltransferase [Ulvibacter litoralis]SDE74504.1 dimethylhistidine N-methyltransferase [Ulvibacter litoralis]